MRKTILSFLITFTLLIGGYLFYHYKTNQTKNEYVKILSAKDLDPKSFITLFTEKYDKGSLNIVTMIGDFPDNWVKPNDVQYLMSIMYSKEKCCGYMSIFSSFISNEEAEIGGFAILFLNSYISKTKINLGLNSSPKTDQESIKKIEDWYRNTADKN